jgi:hypothetical protein
MSENNVNTTSNDSIDEYVPTSEYKTIIPLFGIVFDGTNEECGICKLSLNDASIAYQTDNIQNQQHQQQNDKSKLGLMCFTGDCGHSFHGDCITRWLSSQTGHKKCPYCIKEYNIISKTTIKTLSN